MMNSTLNALKQYTTVVADTGDIQAVVQWQPVDATTNPSLILKAAKHPEHTANIHEVLKHHRNKPMDEQVDRVLVAMGCSILQHIPGRVSTEVDARLSFDAKATLLRARRLVKLYRAFGIDTEKRLLIKIASTWEGIQAARVLEQEGIHCNLTLLFSLVQAHACAKAGVRLISPFVGRIYDWHKKQAGPNWIEDEHKGTKDPGVESVKRIYAHFKQNGFTTQVMGASFRNIEQITALCGCDLLTISPELLAQLGQSTNPCPVMLTPEWAQAMPTVQLPEHEAGFRYMLNEDAMATEKLAEGIRLFVMDTIKLETLLKNVAS